MTQALYAHMNNKTIKIKKNITEVKRHRKKKLPQCHSLNNYGNFIFCF
jgi:hypothetical protein